MNNMVTKLSSVAALLGVVGAIGAGFVQYGKVMAVCTELDRNAQSCTATRLWSPSQAFGDNSAAQLLVRANPCDERQPICSV